MSKKEEILRMVSAIDDEVFENVIDYLYILTEDAYFAVSECVSLEPITEEE